MQVTRDHGSVPCDVLIAHGGFQMRAIIFSIVILFGGISYAGECTDGSCSASINKKATVSKNVVRRIGGVKIIRKFRFERQRTRVIRR